MKRISINPSTTFQEFRVRIRTSFIEEITTKKFRVYRLPHNLLIEDRVLIETEDNFRKCVELLNDPDEYPPELYIWNYEDEQSPQKLPENKIDEDCCSALSRDSKQSKMCKAKDNNTCLCCHFVGAGGFALKAAHIYEFGAHNGIKTGKGRAAQLQKLNLIDINELRNMVTLCETCHNNFDAHKIGIHPADLRWIVTDALRGLTDLAPSKEQYVTIHGKPVKFNESYKPPLQVLQERHNHFEAGQISGGKIKSGKGEAVKSNFYCHFCLEVFPAASGLGNKDAHVQLCRLTAETSELDI